jgi:hypothetical protein
MEFSPVYLARRMLYRVVDFFHHWYVDGSQSLVHRFVGILESMDETLAIAITARHFFEPLYKDYTIIGRILGVIFRSIRIFIGLIVYTFVGAIFVIIYAAWVAIPAVLLFYAFRPR